MKQPGSNLTVGIAGAGIIGMTIAWKLLHEGCRVLLFDSGLAGHDTSLAGAGMIAPNAEAGFEEIELLKQNNRSLQLFPQMLRELTVDAGIEAPSLNTRGSLLAGLDADDMRVLERMYEFRKEAGLHAEWLSGSEAREREPLLSPRVTSAMWLPEDAEIDNRALMQVLKTAFLKMGGSLFENRRVLRVLSDKGRVTGLETGKGNAACDRVVISAGVYSGDIKGIPGGWLPPLRPVKGQIVNMRQTEECSLQVMVRTPRIYMVPKDDGRLMLGATSEEKGFDRQVTAGAVWYLLNEGRLTVPAIHECPKDADMSGLRPATPDNKPVIGGSSELSGLFTATGFFRHGYLLAPLTANLLTDCIINDDLSGLPGCFLPERFMRNKESVT